MTEMGQAAGSSEKEMSIVEESISYKLNALKQTWVSIAQDVLNKNSLGDIVNMFTRLSEAIQKVVKAGGGLPVLAGAFLGVKQLTTGHGLFDFQNGNILNQNNLLGSSITQVISAKKYAAEAAQRVAALSNINIADPSKIWAPKINTAIQQGLRIDQGFLKNNLQIANKDIAASIEQLVAEKQKMGQEFQITDKAIIQSVNNTKEQLINANTESANSFSAIGSVAKSVAAGLLSFGTMMLASLAVGAIVKEITAFKQANDKLIESAKRVGEQYKSAKEDISSYEKEVSELQKTINDANTSHDDSIKARERLLAIQDEMIEKYGAEASAIRNITSAITGEDAAFNSLRELQRQKAINEFNDDSGKSGAEKRAAKNLRNRYGAKTNYEALKKQIESQKLQIDLSGWQIENQTYEKYLAVRNSIEKLGNVQLSEMVDSEGLRTINSLIITTDGNIQDINKTILQLQRIAENNSDLDLGNLIKQLQEYAKSSQDALDSGTIYWDEIDNDISLSSYNKVFQSIESQHKRYQEAIVDQNKELAQTLKDQLQHEYDDVVVDINADPTLSTENKVAFRKRLEQLLPEIMAEQGIRLFKADFPVNIDVIPELKENDSKDKALVDKYIEAKNKAISKGIINSDYQFGDEIAKQEIQSIKNEEDQVVDSFESIMQDHIDQMNRIRSKFGIEDSSANIDNNAFKEFSEGYSSGIDSFNSNSQIVIDDLKAIEEEINNVAEASNLSPGEFIQKISDGAEKAESYIDNLSDKDKQFVDAIEALNKFGNEETLLEYQRTSKETFDGEKEAYDTIINLANAYDLELKDIIPLLREIADLSNFDRSGNVTLSNAYADANGFDFGNVKLRRSEFSSGLNLVSDNAYNYAVSNAENDELWRSVYEQATHINETSRDNIDMSHAIAQALEQEYDKWLKIEDEQKKLANAKLMTESETIHSLSTAPSETMKSFSESMGSIKTAIQSVVQDGLDKINIVDLTKDINDQIQAIKEQRPSVDTSSFENLIEVLRDTKSTTKDVEKAFEQIATTFIDAGVTGTESFETLKVALKDMGVINNEIVAFSQLLSNMEAMKNAGYDLVAMSDQLDQSSYTLSAEAEAVASSFVNEKVSADYAGQALALLKIKMILINSTGINTSAQCSELLKLAGTANIAAASIDRLNSLKGLIAKRDSSTNNNVKQALQAQIDAFSTIGKADLQKQIDNMTADLDWSGLSSGGSGGGGGGGKDAAEEQEDIMAKLSSQLDEIQEKYKSLTEIMEHYNETGKITVDEAQAILQSDFRYLALLGDENAALAVNEQGFVDLAKAKLNEMQIQLARNALNTINSLQTEADAVKYLSNQYLELGANVTGAVGALKAAVDMKMKAGGAMAEAAQTIWQGYQNAAAMLEHVDFSKEGMGATSDKTGDENDRNNGDEEEEFLQELILYC